MKKKIIFFHPYFSDGGVERTNIGLARGLIENGYEVTFLTTSYTEHFINEINELGIEFVSFGDKKVSLCIFNVIKFLNTLTDTYKIYFISCQYYVNVFSMLVSLLVKNRKNIKLINSERNHLDEFKVNYGIKYKIVLFMVKISYKYVDIIIANSKETADDLGEFLNLDVKFAYNPTINKRLISLKNEELNEKWFLDDNRKCIIAVGRLSLQKDFITLLKAYNLFDKKDKYKLVILGEGKERKILEHYISLNNLENDVYLPGFVSNPYKFINKSVLFILSSVYEGLPNVLIEALYLKIPSISTNCKSGPKEILLNDDLLINVADYRSMVNKMKYILDDDKRANILLKNAFENIDRFKYENCIKSFIEVIEQ